ncbi:MAG: hypothetical protein GY832_03390 [Chloroflexi bacterium]|nr:hypothetical protein [Chloroflexota bacterium]
MTDNQVRSPINPYIAGAPVKGETMFFGRDDIFEAIRTRLVGRHQDNVIVIYGQRRTGKTSVLYQMGHRLNEDQERYVAVLVDLQGLKLDGVDNFLWELARTIIRVAHREYQLDLPAIDRTAFQADARGAFRDNFLPSLCEAIGERRLLLMFDEAVRFEETVLSGQLERDVFNYLRSLMQHEPDLSFIFSLGSKLEHMRPEYALLFNTALYIKVSFLDEVSARALITEPVSGLYIFEEDAINRLLTCTSRHPYFTQVLCHTLFTRWERERWNRVTPTQVDAVLDEATDLTIANLQYIWNEANRTEKLVLAALAEIKSGKANVDTLLRHLEQGGTRLKRPKIVRALSELERRLVIDSSAHPRFCIALVYRWLAREKPLDWVRGELSVVDETSSVIEPDYHPRSKDRTRPTWRPVLALGVVMLIALAVVLLVPGISMDWLSPTSSVIIHTPEFSGDYIEREESIWRAWLGISACSKELPRQEAFTLGAESFSCQAGKQGGTVTFTLSILQPDDTHMVVLHALCPKSTGCVSAVDAQQAGTLSLYVDEQVLWTATCSSDRQCDYLALGQGPLVAFTTDVVTHQVRLDVSPGINWSIADLEAEWIEIPALIQGVAYSPFRDCQNPNTGVFPTEQEIREDLTMIQHMGNAIRTYSATGTQKSIAFLAQEAGLRVSAGASLGPDLEENEKEIANLIELAQMVDLESVIVGNEVILRRDLTQEQLIGYIQRVKANVDVPVTTAEIESIFLESPDLIESVDYLLVNIHAYWDGQAIENAARYVIDRYQAIQEASGGKRVVIGETGWPSSGPVRGSAVPRPENQYRFLHEFLILAQQKDVEFYYFTVFDELWKTEGGVGPHWGVMYADRRNKYNLQSLLIPLTEQYQVFPIAMPSTPSVSNENVLYVYRDYSSQENHFVPSGWIGDISSIHFNDCFQWDDNWIDRAIEVQYIPSLTDENGWAGIYWQYPANNWGTMPEGYDLQNYTQLRFRAKSDQNGTKVKFFVGGVSAGDYPSSIPVPLYAREADSDGFVTLSTNWYEFHIDLVDVDLSHVIDGFGWMAERDHVPDGATLYLDNILFDQDLLLSLPITPITLMPTSVPSVDLSTTPPQTTMPLPTSVSATHFISKSLVFADGYDMGVNTSDGLTGWVADMGGYIRMDYPSGQDWGAVFITWGEPTGRPRPYVDLSNYRTLSLELRGEVGGEMVWIGLKDNTDPDNGSETKFLVDNLTTEWQTFTFRLSDFKTAKLTKLYVVTEFVFGPNTPTETVYFRNIRYLP